MLRIPLPLKDRHNRRRALARWLRTQLGFVHVAELAHREAGTDAEHFPAQGAVLVRLTCRYHVQRRLRRTIRHSFHLLMRIRVVQAHRNRARAARHIDDARRRLRLLQQSGKGFDDYRWACGVCQECCAQALRKRGVCWCFAGDGGVVYKGVDASIFLPDSLCSFINTAFAVYIDMHKLHLSGQVSLRQVADCGLAFLEGSAAQQDEVRLLGEQLGGDFEPNASICTSNKSNLYFVRGHDVGYLNALAILTVVLL